MHLSFKSVVEIVTVKFLHKVFAAFRRKRFRQSSIFFNLNQTKNLTPMWCLWPTRENKNAWHIYEDLLRSHIPNKTEKTGVYNKERWLNSVFSKPRIEITSKQKGKKTAKGKEGKSKGGRSQKKWRIYDWSKVIINGEQLWLQ